MLVWMLYATAVGAVFSAAALLAASGLRRSAQRARGVRWVWAATMAATAVVPFVAGLAAEPAGAPSASGWSPGPAGMIVLLAWVGAAFALLADIRLSGWTVRRNARSWRSDRSAGRRVLVSAAFGPGVIGARAPRIVLPEWAVGASPALERLIVAHEEEHVRAGDTRLLLAAVVLVALLPWCLPLWWQLHRLRGAIEADCDARVVERTGDARAYAEALVAVAGRRPRRALPVPALAPRRGELERRIRHVTATGVACSRGRALGRVAAAVLVVAATAALPAPELPLPTVELAWSFGAPPSDGPRREATVILSVAPAVEPTLEPEVERALEPAVEPEVEPGVY